MPLRVDMTGSSTGFTRMLDQARADVRSFADGLGEDVRYSFTRAVKGALTGFIGAEVLEKIAGTFSWFVQTGTQIKDISDQLQMSTGEWQKWSDAVQQAGLQTEGFVRVIESLKQKRTEALTDPKARAELTQLGFTDAEISGPMSTSDFAQKALQNANANPYASKAFDSIAGVEGVRYMRALGYLPSAEANMSQRDIANAERLQSWEHTLKSRALEPVEIGAVGLFTDPAMQNAVGLTAWRLLQGAVGRGWLWNRGASWKDGILNTVNGLPENYHPAVALRGDQPIPKFPFVGPHNPKDDPLYAVLQNQNQQFALRDQERNQRIMDSDRALMTIGDRFASIRKEMGPLSQQIQQREAAMKTPEGFLTQAQKDSLMGITGFARTIQVNEMRQKYLDETAELKMRLNKDKLDTRQAPLSFHADNLAKVGLYSASALKFNPVLGIAKEQLVVLKDIAQSVKRPGMQPPNDPYRP